LENKLCQGNERQRKINTIIFGLQQEREESYFKTLNMVVKCLSETIKVETMIKNIDYVARLGGRGDKHPI
jgi:hypothetical protein